jgi:hypothetical protein
MQMALLFNDNEHVKKSKTGIQSDLKFGIDVP